MGQNFYTEAWEYLKLQLQDPVWCLQNGLKPSQGDATHKAMLRKEGISSARNETVSLELWTWLWGLHFLFDNSEAYLFLERIAGIMGKIEQEGFEKIKDRCG